MTAGLSYCAALVRAHDHDRYLCTLFAPPAAREAWFALFAFNHEVAAIPEMVSEEMIGFVRYAWWREALDEIYGARPVRRHPVAEALAQAVTRHRLPRAPLDALIDAREKRFTEKAMQERPEWEAYFRASSSSLLELCAHAAGCEASQALEALGIAWGAIGTARMFFIAGDTESGEELRRAGREWLDKAQGLPNSFASFRDVAEFNAKKLENDRGRKGADSLFSRAKLCFILIIRGFLRAGNN